jgi:hypothetical protein
MECEFKNSRQYLHVLSTSVQDSHFRVYNFEVKSHENYFVTFSLSPQSQEYSGTYIVSVNQLDDGMWKVERKQRNNVGQQGWNETASQTTVLHLHPILTFAIFTPTSYFSQLDNKM